MKFDYRCFRCQRYSLSPLNEYFAAFINSQELLAVVEMEKSARQRHVAATGPSYMRHYQEFDSENVSYMSVYRHSIDFFC